MLLIHYLDKFPEIRPFGDTTRFADTSNLKWISFTSILNTIGPRQSAHAWQSVMSSIQNPMNTNNPNSVFGRQYVRNANDNISRDCDEEQIKQMSTLEHGIAQMRWPDIFGGYESFVQLPYFKTESKHDRRLLRAAQYTFVGFGMELMIIVFCSQIDADQKHSTPSGRHPTPFG